jgi:hypothetical protein
MPEDQEAVFVHGGPVRLFAMLVSLLGVFQSLPGALMPGLMVLFLVSFRGAAMSVGRAIVHLGRPLMVFVVRSVVVMSRH